MEIIRLAHAPDIISRFNNGLELEQLSEEGLKVSSKLFRRYREILSHKYSLEDYIKDVLHDCCVRMTHSSYLIKDKKSIPDASVFN